MMEIEVINYELDEIIRMHNLWLNGLEGGARANLTDRNLGAALRGANLSYANLSDSNLCTANLRSANMRGTVLIDANLRDANLSGANLCDANFLDASLHSANLTDANLTGANLSGADLRNANLGGAILTGADLRGANLSGADLSRSVGGPPYYSISWSGHGEIGRRLHAVEQNGKLVFSCGCFSGSADELLEYIEQGDTRYNESRLRSLDIIMELHDEDRDG